MITEIGLITSGRVISVDGPVGLFLFKALPQYAFHHFAMFSTQSPPKIATLGLLSLDGFLKLKELLPGRASVTL